MRKKPISNKDKQRMLKGVDVDKDRRDTFRGIRTNSRILKPK